MLSLLLAATLFHPIPPDVRVAERLNAGATGAMEPRIASRGPDALVVWRTPRPGAGLVGSMPGQAMLVGSDARPRWTQPLLLAGNALPAVAASPRTYLVVQADVRGNVAGHLIDSIHPRPRRVTLRDVAEPVFHYPVQPEVVWDGRQYVVVAPVDISSNRARIAARFVSEDGAVISSDLDVEDLDRLDTSRPPAVAARNGTTIVAWGSNFEGVHFRVITSNGSVGPDVRVADTGLIVAAAAGDDGFLLVYHGVLPGIRARRIGFDGNPQGPETLVVPGEYTFYLDDVFVAWTGAEYLVTWNDVETTSDVRAVRVAADARPLDSTPFTIANAPGRQQHAMAAPVGNGVVVAYAGASGIRTASVRGREVTPIPSAEGFALDAIELGESVPRAAWTGTDYMVAWRLALPNDQTEIRAGRVTANGVALDGSGVRVTEWHGNPLRPLAIAAGGGTTLVVWRDDRIRAARLDSAGRLLDAQSLILEPTPCEDADAVWNGREFVVAVSCSTIRLKVIPPRGNPTHISFGYGPGLAAIAFNGKRYLLAVLHGSKVRGTFVDANFSPHGRPIALSEGLGARVGIDVAAGGHDFLFAWRDVPDRVTGVAVTGDGRVSPPRAFANIAGDPRIIGTGAGFLLFFQSGADALYVRNIASDGQPLGDEPELLPYRAAPAQWDVVVPSAALPALVRSDTSLGTPAVVLTRFQ